VRKGYTLAVRGGVLEAFRTGRRDGRPRYTRGAGLRMRRPMTDFPEQVFPGTLDSLESVRDYVASVARVAGLDERAAYRLCLAVDEIATNVVTHGYEEAGVRGELKIAATADAEALIVRLEDSGQPFDSTRYMPPAAEDLTAPLESRRIGGLGILLARKNVDELQYAAGSHGNVHRFVVRLPGKPVGPGGTITRGGLE
jgi:serine/threonine-protein kinase RsbW